jgi:molybdopterin-guanine dinucleotide biosynthesis protein A
MLRRHALLSGFVLAGGESRRMGQPKHLLQLGGETMLERQIRLLRSVARFVAVIGSAQSPPGLAIPVFPDEIPGRGPLGGILTGLRHTRTEFNLFVGCDLPFITPRFLGYLARCALESQAEVTAPEDGHGAIQPLCAVYRRRALSKVRASLVLDINKTSGFFDRTRCEIVPWRDIARGGFTPRIFVNINTTADYQAAAERIK